MGYATAAPYAIFAIVLAGAAGGGWAALSYEPSAMKQAELPAVQEYAEAVKLPPLKATDKPQLRVWITAWPQMDDSSDGRVIGYVIDEAGITAYRLLPAAYLKRVAHVTTRHLPAEAAAEIMAMLPELAAAVPEIRVSSEYGACFRLHVPWYEMEGVSGGQLFSNSLDPGCSATPAINKVYEILESNPELDLW